MDEIEIDTDKVIHFLMDKLEEERIHADKLAKTLKDVNSYSDGPIIFHDQATKILIEHEKRRSKLP